MEIIAKDDRLCIRKMEETEADLGQFLLWMTDPETMRFWEGMTKIYDYELVLQEHRAGVQEGVAKCMVELDGKKIGFCQFYTMDAALYEMPQPEWDRVVHPGETVYGIDMFIGDVSCRDRGIGTRILNLLCETLFQTHHADVLMIDPKVHNARAIACYRKCGFREVCVVPQREEQDGILHDSLIMCRRKEIDRRQIGDTARAHLARHLCCEPADFDRGGVVYAANTREPYPFLEICTMGGATVVSASEPLLPRLKALFAGKCRDEIFECPFVYGQTICYVPDLKRREPVPLSSAYTYELLQGAEIDRLQGIRGFENSLAFDENGKTPTHIVLCAKKDGEIVAIAGASDEAGDLWEVGVDVRPAHRRGGLATALVRELTDKILEKGIVPFYSASVTNLGSQYVAARSGYIPCWVSTYRTILDGSSAYNGLLGELKGRI
ncbi:MAG: GNAT family N-acetyltransferase [Hominenteromicrobium sp.]